MKTLFNIKTIGKKVLNFDINFTFIIISQTRKFLLKNNELYFVSFTVILNRKLSVLNKTFWRCEFKHKLFNILTILYNNTTLFSNMSEFKNNCFSINLVQRKYF